MRERGVALHAFDAEMSDELTVLNGEEVCSPPSIPLHPPPQLCQEWISPQTWWRAFIAPAGQNSFRGRAWYGLIIT